MAACANCGAALPRAARECPECATPVTARSAPKPAKKASATAAKPARKPAAKPAKPAKPAKAVKAAVAAKPGRAAESVTAAKAPGRRAAKAAPPAPAEDALDAPAGTPPQRRRAALAADGSVARRRALHGATPPAEGGYAPEPATPIEPLSGWGTADAVGDADERDPAEPVVPLPPARPGLFDGPLLDAVDAQGRPILLARVLRGDWRRAALTALPAVVVAVVVTALAAVALLMATQPQGDELLLGETSPGRWLRYVCVGVGLAFGAPLSGSSDGIGFFPDDATLRFPPLTVTLLALGTLWALARRTAPAEDDDWLPGAIRTAAVFAAGVAAVSLMGRWQVEFDTSGGFLGDEERVLARFSVAPQKAFFWAFLAALGATALARPFRLPARWAAWGVSARGALAGLGAGLAAGFVAAVALAYARADAVGANAADVTRALPFAAAYAVNIGAVGLGVLSGGQAGVPYVDTRPVSLWADWVPWPYAGLLVVPALAALAGAFHIVRRGGLPPAEAARACARMGVPAALAWWALAVVGAAALSSRGFAAGTVGPRSWDALLVGVWFGAVGWLAGRLLTRRAAPVDPPEGAPVP